MGGVVLSESFVTVVYQFPHPHTGFKCFVTDVPEGRRFIMPTWEPFNGCMVGVAIDAEVVA